MSRRTNLRFPTAAPNWRDMVWPMLHPAPQDTALHAISAWRALFWMTLVAVFVAGVAPRWLVLYLIPAAVQRPKEQSAPVTIPPPELVGTNYPAGTRIRDCADDALCPWLRVLPPGFFRMGSPKSEAMRFENEGPQHTVTITSAFAVMETEVTRAQYARFVTDTNRRSKERCDDGSAGRGKLDKPKNWQSPGFAQTDAHPAVCVDWDDAIAFAAWWSGKTSATYRLLTEAEWEYAARAASSTRYSFGASERDLCQYANMADQDAKDLFKNLVIADCADGAVHTASVRTYKPNGFGLHDMHGNVSEWVADCWHESYQGAPVDGTGWQKNCSRNAFRVYRSGSWANNPDATRSAFRYRRAPGEFSNDVGFRMARTLTPPSVTRLPAQPSR